MILSDLFAEKNPVTGSQHCQPTEVCGEVSTSSVLAESLDGGTKTGVCAQKRNDGN